MTSTVMADLRRSEIAGRLTALMANLGDTPQLIAVRMAEAGITGEQSDAVSCPIANYLRICEPRLATVVVLGDEVEFTVIGDSTDTATTVDTPDAVNSFVTQFDTEHYPHLVTPLIAVRRPPATCARRGPS